MRIANCKGSLNGFSLSKFRRVLHEFIIKNLKQWNDLIARRWAWTFARKVKPQSIIREKIFLKLRE